MASTAHIRNYDEWYAFLMELCNGDNESEAIQVIEAEKFRFNDNLPLTYHLHACLTITHQRNLQKALDILQEALDAGFWYTDEFWNDDDFATICTLPDFERMRKLSDERLTLTQSKIRPEMLTITPIQTDQCPLVMALHGNDMNIASECNHWRSGAQHGWIVGMPQASQAAQPNTFVWDNFVQTELEIKAHFDTLRRAYDVDLNRIILGGFSMGAETAIRLALKGIIPAQGFVAICPGGPFTHQTPEAWQPLLENDQTDNIKGIVIVGGCEPGHANIHRLVKILREGGISIGVYEYSEMGHGYPPGFEKYLPDFLNILAML